MAVITALHSLTLRKKKGKTKQIERLGGGIRGFSIAPKPAGRASGLLVVEERKQEDRKISIGTQGRTILKVIDGEEGTDHLDENSVTNLVLKERPNKRHVIVQEAIFGKLRLLLPVKVGIEKRTLDTSTVVCTTAPEVIMPVGLVTKPSLVRVTPPSEGTDVVLTVGLIGDRVVKGVRCPIKADFVVSVDWRPAPIKDRRDFRTIDSRT